VVYSLDNPKLAEVENIRTYLADTWNEVRNRTVAGAFLASIITFVLLYGSYQTYLPILLDTLYGVDSFGIGIILAMMSLATAITASQIPWITGKISLVWIIRVGFMFYGLALFIVPLINELWMIFIPITLFGIGHGLNIPSISALLAGQTCLEHRGAVMSLNGMVLRIGQSTGPLLMGVIFIQLGLNWVYLIGSGLALLAILLLVPIKERTISIHTEEISEDDGTDSR
jgi:MFS family permease